MTAPTSTVLDVADFLDTPAPALVRAVMSATLPIAADAGSTEYYAARLPELGLNLQQRIAALASIVPGARARLPGAPGSLASVGHADLARLRETLFAASDPARRGMIEQCIDHAAVAPAALQMADPDQPGPGHVTAYPTDENTASAYFGRKTYRGWRAENATARGDVACLIAARDRRLGLLLGPGIVFNGSINDAGGETLPPGLVLCGPRAPLASGHYWLDAKITLAAADRLHLDIASNRGLRRLVEIELSGSFRMMLGFDVTPTDDAIEIRLTNQTGEPVAARIGRVVIRM